MLLIRFQIILPSWFYNFLDSSQGQILWRFVVLDGRVLCSKHPQVWERSSKSARSVKHQKHASGFSDYISIGLRYRNYLLKNNKSSYFSVSNRVQVNQQQGHTSRSTRERRQTGRGGNQRWSLRIWSKQKSSLYWWTVRKGADGPQTANADALYEIFRIIFMLVEEKEGSTDWT